MSNPKGVDWEEIQTSNWNVAKPYTTEKILKWLVLIDEYQTISIFGYSKLESDIFYGDKNVKNVSRLHALKRLIHSMMSLIRNTEFAILKKDKEDFKTYTERLKKIEKNLHKLRQEKKRGKRIVELNIDEELFGKMMNELNEMINGINSKLNNADLIFTHTEEHDPKKIKEAYKQKYINRA